MQSKEFNAVANRVGREILHSRDFEKEIEGRRTAVQGQKDCFLQPRAETEKERTNMKWVTQTAYPGLTAGDDDDPGVDCGAFGDGACEHGDAFFTEANAMNRNCQLSGLTPL